MRFSGRETDSALTTDNSNFFKTSGHSGPYFPYILASLYCIIGGITLMQLSRIHFMMRIRKWTMQKAFQTLNVVICIFRAGTLFAYHPLHDYGEKEENGGLVVFIIDVTSLLFFTTYTLLVLFWADIVRVAMEHKGLCSPLTTCVVVNIGGYVSAALLWSLCSESTTIGVGRRASAIVLTVLDLMAVLATCYYGISLRHLLNYSQEPSIVLTNKIREVTLITAILVMSFVSKAAIEILCTTKRKGLTYSEDAFLDVTYYAFAEILTMGSVLTLLSRTPRSQQLAAAQCLVPTEGTSSVFHDPYQESSTGTPYIPYRVSTNDY